MDNNKINIEEDIDNKINPNEIKKKINYFTYVNQVKDMEITLQNQIKVSLKDIIEFANLSNKKTTGYLYNDKNLPIIITDINNLYFSFNICGINGIEIFRHPINYKHSNGDIYEFVSTDQIINFWHKFTFPLIQCKTCKGLKSKTRATIINLFEHKKHDFLIIEGFNYKILNSKEINEFFASRPTNFINKEFETPISFEKNFNYYLNNHGKNNINHKFYIYDDDNDSRLTITIDIKTREKKVLNYFGPSGIGKSVTLIGALKYRKDFGRVGSLYINCKAIKNLLSENKNKVRIVKQIFIDEILFFNPNNYLYYESAVNIIKNFKFENQYSYWDLILNILEKCINNKINYIIAFDQYNQSQDLYNKLNEIKNKIRQYSNIKLVIFSSMNETDIKSIKIKDLFEELYYEDEIYCEIEDVCQISDNNLTQEQQIALKKMGNSFKEFIEIKSSTNIKEYLKEKKYKVSKKIISFYLSKNEKNKNLKNKYFDNIKKIIEIPPEIIGNLLIFTPGYAYDRNSLLEIIEFIPFKFFKIISEDNKFYKVKFGFPFIKEVMLSLYKKIMIKHSYLGLKNILKNKGSGLGTIFQLIVIDNLSPETGPINIFNNFSFSGKYNISSIIKRDNKKEKNNLKLGLFKNKAYLIEQEQFNGKDLDLLIMNIKDNDIYIYGFQISIYKKNIFEKSYLKKTFLNMFNNLNDIFGINNFKNKYLYFGYIFDYSRVNDYNKILSDCENLEWKYCFFDTNKKIFCTKTNFEIHNINEIVTQIILDDKIDCETPIFQNLFLTSIINDNYLYIIKDLVSKEKGKNINNLKYIGEKEGPIVTDNTINVLVLPQSIEVVYVKDYILVGKTIDKSNKEIYDFITGGVEIGKYHIYEF